MSSKITPVLDTYSWMDYKPAFDDVTQPNVLPSWVGDHARRLNAYALLEAYYTNSSRWWLTTNDDKDKRREYGDGFILVETAVTSLLGDKQAIVVEQVVAEGDGSAEAEIQGLLDGWAESEKFFQKMIESERQACKYGDSVYVLAPDADKGRPVLHVYDPGFYFPVFDPLSRKGSEQFPNKVHIAWEFTMKNSLGEDKDYVRRITWELVEVETPYQPQYSDQLTKTNCLYSDAYWELSEVGRDMTVAWGSLRTEITPPILMNIDFIPVVHVPNRVSLQQHFGQSVLAPVCQILDDVQATDTDLQAASATTGTPPIAVSGRTGAQNVETYGPGKIFYVGDGNATVLDTSSSLDALLKLKDALLERLSVNSRTPEALLGRVKPNEVPSGIAMTLSFAPHSGMIGEMRIIRREKYRLLFKFALRMMGVVGDPVVDLVFGSFLPADKQETTTEVTQLLAAQAISLETAVTLLIEAGFTIDDVTAEVARIQSRDTGKATELMGLTGDPNVGLAYMGLPTGDPAQQANDNPLPT